MGRRAWRTAICAFGLAAVGGSAEADECGTCHPEQRVVFETSVHRSEEFTCTGCHGGDGEAQSVEAAHRGEFAPLTDRLDQPRACAACHSDLERMRPYNLPIDQYALFLTSRHGKAFESGDRRSAICSDCHGNHGVVRVSDPASPAYSRNIVSTCEPCHGDPELASAYGLNPSTPDEYRRGVHGRALIEGGNLAAPNCTDCHGVHGAAPPTVGNIEKVCGSCHDETRNAFHDSPHRRAMQEADLPECASCHSNHEIRRIERSEVRQICHECHEADSDESRVADEMQTLLDDAEHEIQEAEQLVVQARSVPVAVEEFESRLEEARTYLTEALTLVHTLSPAKVGAVTQRALAIAREVDSEIRHELDPTNRLIVLAAFWFYLLMTLAVLVVYRRRLGRSEVSR